MYYGFAFGRHAREHVRQKKSYKGANIMRLAILLGLATHCKDTDAYVQGNAVVSHQC